MGADINVKDAHGRTALDWATKAGYFEYVAICLHCLQFYPICY